MQADGRADWCGINHFHGKHGESAKGGSCPGLKEGRVPNPNRASKANAERAVGWMNAKARELGMVRRYEFVPGSSSNGIHHRLIEIVPEMNHPVVDQPIGRTYAEAMKALDAMNRALAGVLADRHRSRMATLNGTYDRNFILPES